jgi:hypothetical protein
MKSEGGSSNARPTEVLPLLVGLALLDPPYDSTSLAVLNISRGNDLERLRIHLLFLSNVYYPSSYTKRQSGAIRKR